MNPVRFILVALALTLVGNAAAETFQLNFRSQQETAEGSGKFHSLTKSGKWKAKETAIVVCDMWNDHYCRNAARRVGEMAPRMNEVLKAARKQGALIIHCPSGCMKHYADTPQRKLAQQAPEDEARAVRYGMRLVVRRICAYAAPV